MAGNESRGQAHTLEGIAAAILIVSSVVFALQVTAVTPLTASTASQHIENQQRGAGNGLLATADASGALRESVLYWNDTRAAFYGTEAEGFYVEGAPPTRFGEMLEDTFDDAGLAFNVNVHYLTSAGDERSRRMVYLGNPSDHAVTVGRTITLYDDDVLLDEDGTETATTLAETDRFFAPNVDESSHVYNVVRVEVTVWRM